MVPILFQPRWGGAALAASDSRLQPLLASWVAVLPDARHDPSLDFEDWVEHAARLDAAYRLAPQQLALVGNDGIARFLNGVEVEEGTEVLYLGSWRNPDNERTGHGVFSRYRYQQSALGDGNLANNYAESTVFRAHAGRTLALCGVREYPEDDVTLDLFDCLAQLAAAGHRELVVKVNLPKYALYRLSLPSDDMAAIKRAVMAQEELAWAMVHLAGRNNAFIVQERIPMAFEYRVIVVNHAPVAGAGCVEAFTPLDNEAQWDPKVEQVRSNGNVEHRPEVAAAYAKYAEAFAKAYRAERPQAKHYTLDLAMSENGIVAIELNPLRNYGLYALDFDAVLQAHLTDFPDA